MDEVLLCFEDERPLAMKIASAAGISCESVRVHRFPDGEIKLRLPPVLPPRVVLLRSLERPNEKLVELLLAARTARALGATRITLIAPYLAYMRQDVAFEPGEAVSQRIVGEFLATLVDALITVDPHLHRVHHLAEAVPVAQAVSLSAAPALAGLIAEQRPGALLLGPDAEAEQWVAAAARASGMEYAVCSKLRRGDHDVEVSLPSISFDGRQVVLMDDVASSGHTLAGAAAKLLAAGAREVDVAVTHALFADTALQLVRSAGVGNVWSTDCIAHSSNAVSVAPMLAAALAGLS